MTKKGDEFVLKSDPAVRCRKPARTRCRSRAATSSIPTPSSIQYGADALRMYEMFMGPLEATKPWSITGVEGISRFLARVWRMIADERADEIRLNPAVQDVQPGEDQLRLLHRTIKAVTEDLERMSFNTAISRLMEFTNEIASGRASAADRLIEPFVLLLSPLAPHVAEELWQLLGHSASAGLRAVARLRRGTDCRSDSPKFPCRSTENCGARSACPPGAIRRPSRRPRATIRRWRRTSSGKTDRQSRVCRRPAC